MGRWYGKKIKVSKFVFAVILIFSSILEAKVATAMRRSKLLSVTAPVAINLTIPANTQNYNIFSAAGSPAGIVHVTLIINAGVTVGSSNNSVAALETGTFAAGSTITIINNGNIIGGGGNGGAGGSGWISVNPAIRYGSNGANGGPALSLHWPVTITNNGNIWGGGGGGGGGNGGNAGGGAI